MRSLSWRSRCSSAKRLEVQGTSRIHLAAILSLPVAGAADVRDVHTSTGATVRNDSRHIELGSGGARIFSQGGASKTAGKKFRYRGSPRGFRARGGCFFSYSHIFQPRFSEGVQLFSRREKTASRRDAKHGSRGFGGRRPPKNFGVFDLENSRFPLEKKISKLKCEALTSACVSRFQPPFPSSLALSRCLVALSRLSLTSRPQHFRCLFFAFFHEFSSLFAFSYLPRKF